MERCLLPLKRMELAIWNPSSVAFWNSNIRAAADNGLPGEALLLYRRMRRAGVRPDHLTFPFLLKSCTNISGPDHPSMVHTHVVKSPFSGDVFVGTAMVNLYAKCSLLDRAEQVFEEMPRRDAAAWNAMMVGLADTGSHGRVFFLFQNMRVHGIQPDSITIISLTQSCGQKKDWSLMRAVHSVGIRIGFGDCVSVCNTWISSYAKCGDVGSAESVFDSIPQSTRSTVSWNSVIAGCAHLDRKVVSYFTSMRRRGIRPDFSTVLCLLSAFGHSEDLVMGRLLHSLSIKAGFHPDITVSNTLISLYSKSGDLAAARRCFDSMAERNCVSWTAIIGGYSKAGDMDQVMDLFRAMDDRADAVTVVAILSSCSQTGSLEFGRSMERYANLNIMLGKNVMVRNALIDMYAKCGSMADARRVFEAMEGRNVVSWTTLIAGCAMNGDFEDALRLFSGMLEQEELEPNHVTFVAVLQACNHGGLLEKGRDLFDMMKNASGLEPRLEHYACMADLLGRRGRIKEALEFIESMPMEPDCAVWGALLGSCIIHRETEAGESAWRRLVQLDPDAAVPYVAMANIYASEEKWEGVARLRVAMRKKGIRKSPGRSIVHVNGRAHEFVVEDRVHPQQPLYEVLESLALNLKVERNGRWGGLLRISEL